MKLPRAISPLWMEWQSYRRRAYPAFVTSSNPPPLDTDGVPVFIFHTVQRERFAAQLRHLADNGYRTIDCDTLCDFVTGRRKLDGPSVMLTFDDGERSLYQVAHPLLKEHGLRAVAFLVTGRIHERVADRPDHGKQWMTWDEVREAHAAGTIDFQSHTHWHEKMFAGEVLRDFSRPGLFTDELLVDRPRVRRHGGEELLLEYGAPLYDLAPRMAAQPKFFDNESAREACIRHVAAHGGPAYFDQPGWRAELARINRAARGTAPAGVFETAQEQRAAILQSLRQSRELLETKLQRPVRHLAYPWATGSALSIALSKEAGYHTNFWGPLPGTPLNRPGQDPFLVARLKDDYLHRLPGQGRVPLADILLHKLRRRTRQADIY